jgi:transcriptional regulator with XRE-family HTH domain
MSNIGDFLTDSENMAELGARLRVRRLERNLTIETLAKSTGLNRKTIMELETGQDVRLSTLIKIFRALYLLNNLNSIIPDSLPSSQYLTVRGQPRTRAYPRGSKIG